MDIMSGAISTGKYPWYDDRIERLPPKHAVPKEDHEDRSELRATPKKIYGYLCQNVWKQEEAKKTASIIMYNCLQGIKSNAMFVGASGSGKTYLWRCLKQIFWDRIEIVDGSSLTQDGWKGSTKWKDLLRSPIFHSGDKNTVLVIDEVDKMLIPKYSNGNENVSHSIQAEGLTMLEGTHVNIKDGYSSYEVDTAKISYVMCGAFSSKAHDVAEKSSGARIGFGAAPKPAQPYARPFGASELLEFGVMPEFMGRVQRIVNLQPMTADDYYQMTASFGTVLRHIRQQYGADVRLTPEKRRELAELAYKDGLGVRGMENQIRQLVDDARFDDCERQCFEF